MVSHFKPAAFIDLCSLHISLHKISPPPPWSSTLVWLEKPPKYTLLGNAMVWHPSKMPQPLKTVLYELHSEGLQVSPLLSGHPWGHSLFPLPYVGDFQYCTNAAVVECIQPFQMLPEQNSTLTSILQHWEHTSLEYLSLGGKKKVGIGENSLPQRTKYLGSIG